MGPPAAIGPPPAPRQFMKPLKPLGPPSRDAPALPNDAAVHAGAFCIDAHSSFGGGDPASNQKGRDQVRIELIAATKEVDGVLAGGPGGSDLEKSWERKALALQDTFKRLTTLLVPCHWRR
jgi:hypothetical protein